MLSSKEILSNSFVVSIDYRRYNAFVSEFKKESIPIIPKKFIGYELTNEYLLGSFKILVDLKSQPIHGVLENNLSLIHSLCNSASHFAIVQHAMLNDMPFVTIFEDDAVPVKGCIEKLNAYCSDIPDDTDVLRIGYAKNGRKNQIDAMKCHYLRCPENLIIKNLSGSHAYIVFKKYYRRFIENNKNLPRCDYVKINPTPDKVVYALKEPLFVQHNIMESPVIHAYRFKDGRIKYPPVS